MRTLISVIICIELLLIAKLAFLLMSRPVPVSINYGNEFRDRCEGRIVVVAPEARTTELVCSHCDDVHDEGALVVEGEKGYLLVLNKNNEWILQYKLYKEEPKSGQKGLQL